MIGWKKSFKGLSTWTSAHRTTPPPLPPSPPSGPPFGTNFSRRKLTQPRPPLPACAMTLIRSTNMTYCSGNRARGKRTRDKPVPARCAGERRDARINFWPPKGKNLHRRPARWNAISERVRNNWRLGVPPLLAQLRVEPRHLLRDCAPAKFFLRARPSRFPEALAKIFVAHE